MKYSHENYIGAELSFCFQTIIHINNVYMYSLDDSSKHFSGRLNGDGM